MSKKITAKNFKTTYGKIITTPVGRLVFPNIARPADFQDDGKFKFSITLVLNKSEPVLAIQAALKELGQTAFGPDYVERFPPIFPGETVLEKIAEPSEQTIQLYSDRLVLRANARTHTKTGKPLEGPKCYLADKSQLPRRPGNEEDIKNIEQVFYGGAFVRATVSPYTYLMGANQGVSLGLAAVQFYKDGERIGRADVEGELNQEFYDDWEQSETAEESEVSELNA